jgi:conjugative relaxase-like TrwC/TraI family protein
VISVHAIRGGSPGAVAEYYLQPKSGCERELDGFQPTGPAGVGRELGLDPDYYLHNPEAVGRWIGEGSAALGLDWPLGGPLGEESRMAFLNALYGNVNGFNVAKPVTRYDENGTKINVRVAAYDVTISAPKSVSTLMALAPPPVARKVLAAHDHAATEAIALLEQLSARAARGHHGDGQRATRIGTDGFIAAAFDHTTSRAHDPQLHTHVVVMNLVRGQDGRWSALDSRTLHRQATTASYLYQHVLRAELTRELGVDWDRVERGVAEIAGIPKSVRREFSTRRAQIEAALTTSETGNGLRGRARTLAAKAACLATRPAKSHTQPGSLRQDWAARATRHGFGPEQAEELLTGQHTPAALDRDAVSAKVLGAEGATRERPTFDQGTVLRELIAALPAGTDLDREQLLEWARQLIHDSEVVPVADAELRTFTTGDMLATEQRLLTLASRAAEPLAVVPAARALPTLIRSQLRPEQRDIAQVLLGSGRPVDVISGPAGSGKTRGLAAAVTVWRTHGIAVRGTAVAALTAQGLQDATGAESTSLTRVLNQPDRHLPEHGVLLVDEAGMIGTRQLLRLLTVAEQRACKVVLVGDPAQLPELEAGGAFAALTRQPAALHLDGHGRQTEAWEQHALHDLRSGRPATALDAYQGHDRLHLATTRDELLTDLVGDYLRHRSEHADPWQVAVLAPRRHDVADLNTLIRHRLVAEGVLGRRRIRIETPEGPRDYRKGDQVLVTRNHHDRQLLNGTRASVRTVRRDGLVLQLTDGRRLVLDKAWLTGGDLDHGYAMTLHKAQGRTVHTSLVLADEGLSQEGGYVGLSRGTTANHLYLDAASEHALRDCDPLEDASPSIAPSRSKALSRSNRQALALDAHLMPGEPPARHAPRLEGPSR